MKTSTSLFIVLILTSSWAASADEQDDFLQCLFQTCENYSSISNVVYTPLRETQIPPVILCSKQSGLEIRTRSGGHDREGLSYVSQVPFAIVDLVNLSDVTVDVDEKTAWIEAGASTVVVYYRIAEKSSTLAFPGSICTWIGVGGHYSGGRYGALLRKYGLAADNVIDVRIVDVNGNILDRKSMGDDLLWAIRGGGGASFGVIIAWKVQLVDVPETVTVFSITRSVEEQNGAELWQRWQWRTQDFNDGGSKINL